MTPPPPRVRVIATAGSIAGIGPDRLDLILYHELGQHLTIEQSLARILEVTQIARVQCHWQRRSSRVLLPRAFLKHTFPRVASAPRV